MSACTTPDGSAIPSPPTSDYLILGSGIAGLYAALLARAHGSVTVVTKASLDEANTRYAQGGVAAALGPDDSPALHLEDTLAAGAGLVEREPAAALTSEGPDRIADLVRLGVPFDASEGAITLGREAAHSAARIVHAGGDATGLHIELTLAGLARQPGITVRECLMATRLLTEATATGRRVVGVAALDTTTGATVTLRARHIILATGGAGQLYRVTTNPAVATGDGIALAYRAGAEVLDLEFMQFHPTALTLPGVPVFLISEAARGEGAVLRSVCGDRFMLDVDPRAELAPRDVVARAIVRQMQQDGSDHVLLDLTHLPAERVLSRFPQISAFCRQHGLDLTRDPLPVSPAAHYTMGGVRTDSWGATTLAGLYACGEVACTGIHGANRLASNSLLEGLVFARRVIERTLAAPAAPLAASADARTLADLPAVEAPPATLAGLQGLMWDNVGIVRDGAGLDAARHALAGWERAGASPTTRAEHELANLITVGRLAAEAAYAREESRGAHYRTDYPDTRPAWRRHLVFRSAGAGDAMLEPATRASEVA